MANKDQDIINVVFRGKIKLLDSIYNFAYTNVREESKKAKKAIIIHYTSHKKPWLPKCHNKLKNVWQYYYKQSNKLQNKSMYKKISNIFNFLLNMLLIIKRK